MNETTGTVRPPALSDHPAPLQIMPIPGLGEILPGADLAALLFEAISRAGVALKPGDVLVVTQKIVSKAENRFLSLDGVVPSAEALVLAETTRKDPRLVEIVLRESTDIVRAVPHVLITRHRLGLVMANAGIDRSNIGPGEGDRVLLLPKNPDMSAETLAGGLARYGARPAVVISDSFGRPWRMGVVAVAIGAAGLPALIDRRGDSDRDGRVLEVTQIAFGDLIASAATLLMGEGAEGVPAVIVRGFSMTGSFRPAAALTRPLAEDLFR